MRRYLISLIICAGALAITIAIKGVYEHSVFSLLICSVALVAYFCGTGPALLVTLVSVLTAAFRLLEPVGSIRVHEISDIVRLVAFTGASGLVIAIVHRLRQTQEQLQTANSDLEYVKTARGVWNWSYDVATERVTWTNYENEMEVRRERSLEGWLGLVHPDDREMVEQSLARALTTGNLEVDYRFQSSADSTIRFLTRAKLVTRRSNDEGRLVGICMEPIVGAPQLRLAVRKKISGSGV
jgi:hypothetical protein